LAELTAPVRLSIGAAAFGPLVIPAVWFFGMNPRIRFELTCLLSKICAKAKSKLRAV
jgi:hypothetical protein